MTLKTIAGFRNTNEAKEIGQAIEFRAQGASIFAHEPSAPKVSAPSAPTL